MKRYICILRGINVGGHRKILMADLLKLLETIDLKYIQTYIQSGNLVFFSSKKADELEAEISETLFAKYGFEVEVVIRKRSQIQAIVDKNPFLKKDTDIKKLFVTFLKEKPSEADVNKLSDLNIGEDAYFINEKEVYLKYENKLSESKINNNVIENKLNVVATTRNWKTIKELLKLAEN